MNTITGRSAFLALLKDEGITHLFGNPGTTELPIMDAMSQHPDLTYVLGLQESIVVAMADGYSRATGKLVACNVHVAPGLGNAMGSLYNAKFTRTPMIITAGQQEQGHGLMEPLLYEPLIPIAQPLVKWAVEVTRLEDLPRIVRRAAKVATTAPCGPVFISLPGDILNDEGGIDLGQSTRVDTAARPTDAALESLADLLIKAKAPAIVAGNEVVTSDALQEVADFAEALGAGGYQTTISYGSHYLSEHRSFMGTLTRVQPQVREALDPYDLIVFIGTDVLRMSVQHEVDPLPPDATVVQIGQDDWEMGKNYHAAAALRGDVRETLRALIPVLHKRGGAALKAAAEKRLTALEENNWSARRAKSLTEVPMLADAKPIDCRWLMAEVVGALPKDAIVVNEALTSAARLQDFLAYRDRYSYHANASGGIGWAIAAAVGIQIAHPDRPVVALIGDGSAMYSIQALWTAANLKLPVTFVITNNKSYRIIKQRLFAFHNNRNFIAMDFDDPPLDFVGLAHSMGLEAVRVENPKDVRPALDAAIASKRPYLVDIIVDGSV